VASTATLLSLGITLALPALLLFLSAPLEAITARALEGESLTAYLDPATADLDGAALAAELAARPDIRRTRYVSRDEALATFRAHRDIDDSLAVLGENPLPGAIVVHPDTTALGDRSVETIARLLKGLPAVERVQVDLDWVRRLQATLSLARRVALLLGGLLVATALLVIVNTVRLELVRRRRELELATLLGAGAAFAHRPVLCTGLLLGGLGGIVACALALCALLLLRGPVGELATLYGSSFRLPLPPPGEPALVVLVSTTLGTVAALATLYTTSVRRTAHHPGTS